MKTSNKIILFTTAILLLVVFLAFRSNWFIKKETQNKAELGIVAESDTKGINKGVTIDSSAISQHDESYYAKSFANVFIKGRLLRDSINGENALRLIYEPIPGYTYLIKWNINDVPAIDGDTIRGFKRGDKIGVVILPFKGGKELPKKVLHIIISNTPPIITPHDKLRFDDKLLTYQVKASDADGDKLVYKLVESPKGAVIDKDSGLLKWDVPADLSGKIQFKVEISDGHGGKTLYPLEVTLSVRN